MTENGGVNIENIRVLQRDLRCGKLPFPSEIEGGVIDIHYYNEQLIVEVKRILAPDVFCFESIDTRGNNTYELTEYGYIKYIFREIEILDYSEQMVKS